MAKRIIARAVIAAFTAAIALALFVGSAAAQPYYLDTLVTGTVTGAPGGTVSVYSGTTPCKTVAGGTIAADGTYQVVVNCDTGTGTLYVDGVATSATFTLIQGTVSSDVNATVGTAPSSATTTPGATGTTATAGTAGATTTTGTASAGTTTPGTGAAGSANTPGSNSENTGRASGSSHTWIFVVAGVVIAALALGAGGVIAVRMRNKPGPGSP